MTTQTTPDITSIEDLDFRLCCDISDNCSREATWLVVVRCGHDFLACDPCWSHLTSAGRVLYVECLRCSTKWLTVGEAVKDAHRL